MQGNGGGHGGSDNGDDNDDDDYDGANDVCIVCQLMNIERTPRTFIMSYVAQRVKRFRRLLQ